MLDNASSEMDSSRIVFIVNKNNELPISVSGTDLVVAITRVHPRTRMVVGKNEWTVVDAKWLVRCEEAGRIEKWSVDGKGVSCFTVAI